jgi:UDP-glucose 4-epimerase
MPSAYNQTFNIGADVPYTLNELARCVAGAMGVAPEVVHLPPRQEVLHAYCSHEKVTRVFGRRRLHTLEEGLTRMAVWVKRHGARASSTFDGIEVLKNFPKAWAA